MLSTARAGPLVPPLDLVGGAAATGHSGLIRARLGRIVAARSTTSPVAAAVLRVGALSALVAISSAGVHPKMSHSAASTGSDNRSGVWVTSLHTWTDDSLIPRSAR